MERKLKPKKILIALFLFLFIIHHCKINLNSKRGGGNLAKSRRDRRKGNLDKKYSGCIFGKLMRFKKNPLILF